MLRFPDPPLSDGVVTLRPKTAADVDALVAACQDPEIPRWTRVPSPYERSDALAWIAVSEEARVAGTAIDWLVKDLDGRLLGSVGLEIKRERGSGEIGYWVAREARGRGVATRAARLVAAWARDALGLRTLEIEAHERNAWSQAVARAAGFEPTDRREPPPREGLPDGEYVVFEFHSTD